MGKGGGDPDLRRPWNGGGDARLSLFVANSVAVSRRVGNFGVGPSRGKATRRAHGASRKALCRRFDDPLAWRRDPFVGRLGQAPDLRIAGASFACVDAIGRNDRRGKPCDRLPPGGHRAKSGSAKACRGATRTDASGASGRGVGAGAIGDRAVAVGVSARTVGETFFSVADDRADHRGHRDRKLLFLYGRRSPYKGSVRLPSHADPPPIAFVARACALTFVAVSACLSAIDADHVFVAFSRLLRPARQIRLSVGTCGSGRRSLADPRRGNRIDPLVDRLLFAKELFSRHRSFDPLRRCAGIAADP